jgi:uncharacterized protein GlcG (DUF336 family)
LSLTLGCAKSEAPDKLWQLVGHILKGTWMFDRIFQPHYRNIFLLSVVLLLTLGSVVYTARARAWLRTGNDRPSIDAQACVYEAATQRLVIRGSNFQSGASLSLQTPGGQLAFTALQVVDASTIYVEGISEAALQNGLTITLNNPGQPNSVSAVLNSVPTAFSIPGRRVSVTGEMAVRETLQPNQLSQAEVEQIIAQAVAQAEANNLRAAIAIVDAEGRALGVFIMNGAPANTRVGTLRPRCTPNGDARPPLPCGLEGVSVPICTAAISKAVTGSFLSSQGHAFSARTASFIVQEHFPPGVNFQASGPLFGVQFSQLLCSDVNPKAPLGLSADPGGLPLYKNGLKVGGIGVEGDGRYTADLDLSDNDVTAEELSALAGTRGFEAPAQITGDKIIVNGIRFPYVNAAVPPPANVRPFNQLSGALNTCLGLAPVPARGSFPSEFVTATLGDAPAGRINTRLFPSGTNSYGSSPDLSRDEVIRLLTQAAKQAAITRAAIRQPLNSPAEVNITVCDAEGKILGIFSTIDAPQFGLDVSAQKARSAAFISNAAAATRLRQAGLGKYVDASVSDGVRLDGTLAVSDRAIGFLARPFYPDGIDRMPPGPFSVPIADFSPFNVGLQLDALRESYFENILIFIMALSLNPNDPGPAAIAAITDALSPPCGNNPALLAVANGFQIFPGSVPLYKGNKLVGAIGISGDGVDQDDIISAMGSTGFEAPQELRSDRIFVRGTRLPYVKFPRHPNL